MLYNLFENRDFVSVFAVALLAEGVDRNLSDIKTELEENVALLAEGVDRNHLLPSGARPSLKSPSSRRAWIEITVSRRNTGGLPVALLAEGVDRNGMNFENWMATAGSPSSRRAWIEMRL